MIFVIVKVTFFESPTRNIKKSLRDCRFAMGAVISLSVVSIVMVAAAAFTVFIWAEKSRQPKLLDWGLPLLAVVEIVVTMVALIIAFLFL